MKKFMSFKSLKKIIAAACVSAFMFSFSALEASAAEVENIGLEAQLIDIKELKSENSLPEKYSSVDMGYVTSVKRQNADNCWVFGTIASCESLFLKNGFTFSDLSTLHLDKFGTGREIQEKEDILSFLWDI